MQIEVFLGENQRVEAKVEGHVVATDQPPALGGGDTAPSPFALFLTSLTTCTAYYALGFCQARDIDPAGLSLVLRTSFDQKAERLTRADLELVLPSGFPEKYEKAIVRVANMCAVKKAILDPPVMELTARRS